MRVLRDERIAFDGKLVTLRRFKDDVDEVSEGLECGVGIENFQDLRERDVLELMAEGRSNRAIASRLIVGDKTVETHVASILSKLGLEEAPDDHRRVLAVLSWLRRA